MTLDELKAEISERIESEGMLLAFQIVSDYLENLEVILDE
jgi:hypothetical protein|nr:MAG TPA: Protein of unknown function (DUF2600) [Caudoviricetes sp.]DAE90110.1 MAG TPA: Protein of unknown function (DUF2600) [Caudoviricetes sp.]